MANYDRNRQYRKFCAYGFLKNLRFFDVFLLLFFLDKGVSYTQIGLLYGARELMINLLEIPSGIIADTLGRKSSLLGAFTAYLISFVVFYYATGFWWLLSAMLLYGTGDAFRSGTHKGMIMDYLRLRNWSHFKIDYYGHTRSWSQRGSALSALAAGILVFYEGSLEHIFLYAIVPYLFNFVNIASYPSELNFSQKKTKVRRSFRFVLRSFWLIIRDPYVLRVVNSAALHSSYNKAVKDYIQPIMVQVALITPILVETVQEKRQGLIIGLIYFVIYLFTSTASRYSSRFASRFPNNSQNLTLLIGFSAGIICGLLFQFAFWVPSLIAFILIFLVENVRKPILTGAVADQVPNDILTSVLSAQSFLSTLMTVFLAVLLGWFTDQMNLGWALIIVSTGLIALTGILHLAQKPKNKPKL